MHRLALSTLTLVMLAATSAAAEERVVEIIGPGGDGKGNQLRVPRGLARDTKGNLFVVGAQSDNVFRVSPDGGITQMIDGSGDGQGHELKDPREITVDAVGNLYVAGETSSNVFRVTPAGEITLVLDTMGDGTEKLGHRVVRPTHLVAGPDRSVYVSSQNSHNVYRIKPDGQLEVLITREGDGQGNELDRPNALLADPEGNVFVAGARSTIVFRIAPGGEVSVYFDAKKARPRVDLRFANDLARDAAGNLYLSANNSGNVLGIAPDGSAAETFPAKREGRFLGAPLSVEASPKGVVYVARMASSGVWRRQPGKQPELFLGPEDLPGGEKGLRIPRGLLLDPKGFLYVSSGMDNRVFRVAPGARPADPVPTPEQAQEQKDVRAGEQAEPAPQQAEPGVEAAEAETPPDA